MSVRTPIIDVIKAHMNRKPLSFHVPGHKNGHNWHSFLPLFEQLLPYDVTELSGLDDLHDAKGAIAESQQLCAEFYGAGETSYLVGGSTSGNLAMIYGVLQEGDTVFVERDCHKSVMHALELCKANVVFLSSRRSSITNHPLGVTYEVLKHAYEQHPQGKAMILTYPNYWGNVIDYRETFRFAKDHRLLLLVDEAHGAHFVVGNESLNSPPSALQLGADIVVQSAHKMLPALTMTGWLHFSNTIDPTIKKQVKHALQMFQSSSPSYVLLASLDGARAFLEEQGHHAYRQALEAQKKLCEWIDVHPDIELVEEEAHFKDPLKLMVKPRDSGTGVSVLTALKQVGIDAEMADPNVTLLILGLSSLHPDTQKRLNHVTIESTPLKEKNAVEAGAKGCLSELIRNKDNKENVELLSLQDAVGRVAATDVIPYPPGIPLLLKGEKISEEHVEQMKQFLSTGVTFQGFQPYRGIVVKRKSGEE
ncbi:aminotransferase class I/II-fold pyridoxal phosphate-dependent enzyme [Shouchella lehensis]|uniref:Aminotransferase class I/II-fold pyridoxal phosphate-dependent enzyme n=1 Tax=Shouchella lehensis TaxID=300825 RepID=A0A4Y7WFW6_9BACI|nr:aminotransferase class I/II-fold pyridoxal phosphate-dependent enzyme [Shouchella lehensis]MBG9782415.1 hypothetical protein [Shouchella lehensis]TES46845.1 aminotransferase class I/II-fold pyridoxal phosphate-dependent enzyme [Shouchella lehensis]